MIKGGRIVDEFQDNEKKNAHCTKVDTHSFLDIPRAMLTSVSGTVDSLAHSKMKENRLATKKCGQSLVRSVQPLPCNGH